MGRGRERDYPGAIRDESRAPRMLSGFAICSVAGPPVRWRRRSGPGCMATQVGAGDDPGEDAQARLRRLPLPGGVLRGPSPWSPPAGGPGFALAPVGTFRSVSSVVVSHILSLVVCDWASVYIGLTGFRTMSFTFRRFGARAYSPTPPAIVSHWNAEKNLPQGPAPVRPLTGPLPSGPWFAHWGCTGFGVCREAGKQVVSKLNQERIGRKCGPNLLTVG